MRIAATAIGLLFALTAFSSHAQEPAASQWRFTETTLFDLVQNGYSIAAVTSGAARIGPSVEDTFFCRRPIACSSASKRTPPTPVTSAPPRRSNATN